MKKLIFIDHQGKKVGEHEVYVEGQDFEYAYPMPTAIWFGKILLVDKEPEAKAEVDEDYEAAVQDLQPEFHEPILLSPVKIVRICLKCDWKGYETDCMFGHDDFLCPCCQTESLTTETDYEVAKAAYEDLMKQSRREVKESESKAASDSGAGDKGLGETGEPKSAEAIPEKPTRRKSVKRSGKPRNPKTA